MTLQLTTRRLLILAAVALLCALYLGNLRGMGIVSTDEPRYADIGRAMAQTGDWVTPRLWGHAWFEKPALLYWMIATGFKLGLGPELAPRLPVALVGLLFLAFFWFRLRTLWDARVASYSTALLATSAGWLAYSHVAVTDIPVAVLFSVAVLLSIEPEGRPARFTLIAATLGLATLAKSLFPLVLFLPVPALDYRRLRSWSGAGPILAFAIVSLPWHILCTLQNGSEFLRVLFIEHQFGRFVSGELQHAKPWWYYVPVLLLLLYPWFPLLLVVSRDLRDRRVRVLTAVVLFGFLFISLSVNKLPGYLLPLLPSICVLVGLGAARTTTPRSLIAVSVALLGVLPPAVSVLPVALATGVRAASIPWQQIGLWAVAGAVTGAIVVTALKNYRFYVSSAIAGVCLLWFQATVFPGIDGVVSARPVWLAKHPHCLPELHRRLIYGLNYYAGRELPRCDILDQSAIPVIR